MLEQVQLRKANQADFDTVLSMYHSCIGHGSCAWNEQYPSEFELQGDLDAKSLYVLETVQGIIGAVTVIAEEELADLDFWRIRDGKHREVTRVCILPRYQGHGYAKQMLMRLFALLSEEGASSVRLLAVKTNESAVSLYRSLDFVICGEINLFGHNHYICEKML